VVQSLRDLLAAGDSEDALDLIHPLRRPLYAEVYAAIADRLPTDAAQMQEFSVAELRPGHAVVVIEVDHEVDGESVTSSFPMQLVRKADGGWWVFEY